MRSPPESSHAPQTSVAEDFLIENATTTPDEYSDRVLVQVDVLCTASAPELERKRPCRYDPVQSSVQAHVALRLSCPAVTLDAVLDHSAPSTRIGQLERRVILALVSYERPLPRPPWNSLRRPFCHSRLSKPLDRGFCGVQPWIYRCGTMGPILRPPTVYCV